MAWVAGVDGCRAGWFAVLRNLDNGRTAHHVLRSFQQVLALHEAPKIIAVDIPIGLLEHAEKGGREADRQARALLGARGCCVFSPPVRPALAKRDYRTASAVNRDSSPAGLGISRQAWGIAGKIREVDSVMKPGLQSRVREAHPELAFLEMARGKPLPPKRGAGGLMERARLLMRAGCYDMKDAGRYSAPGVSLDDVLDAHALCWVAQRIAEGRGMRVPEKPPRDARGLRTEIWR